MSENHTPGPWQIEGKYRGDDGSLYLSTMHPTPIFELVPIVGKEAEHIANAALIAAAPELLDALKCALVEIRKEVEFLRDEQGSPQGWATDIQRLTGILEKAENAITKVGWRP